MVFYTQTLVHASQASDLSMSLEKGEVTGGNHHCRISWIGVTMPVISFERKHRQ